MLPSAKITDIVSAPLVMLMLTLAPAAEVAFKIENLYGYIQKEAGKAWGSTRSWTSGIWNHIIKDLAKDVQCNALYGSQFHPICTSGLLQNTRDSALLVTPAQLHVLQSGHCRNRSPPTDPIRAMRKLWNEIQTHAEKDGKYILRVPMEKKIAKRHRTYLEKQSRNFI